MRLGHGVGQDEHVGQGGCAGPMEQFAGTVTFVGVPGPAMQTAQHSFCGTLPSPRVGQPPERPPQTLQLLGRMPYWATSTAPPGAKAASSPSTDQKTG